MFYQMGIQDTDRINSLRMSQTSERPWDLSARIDGSWSVVAVSALPSLEESTRGSTTLLNQVRTAKDSDEFYKSCMTVVYQISSLYRVLELQKSGLQSWFRHECQDAPRLAMSPQLHRLPASRKHYQRTIGVSGVRVSRPCP